MSTRVLITECRRASRACRGQKLRSCA
jgi:hypothetical protein